MQLSKQSAAQSWQYDDSPMVFSEIFSSQTSIAIWQAMLVSDNLQAA